MADARTNIDPSNYYEGIRLVSEPSEELLNQRQTIDYRGHREDLIKWLLHEGKDPEKAKGYAESTVKRRAHDLDKFYRWVWEHRGGYTTEITHEDADDYSEEYLIYSDYSDHHKANTQKAIKCLFRWMGDEWEPNRNLIGQSRSEDMNPREFLTKVERRKVREASLEYGTVPAYHSLDPDGRDRWKTHLSRRFRKPKSDIGPSDFERANGFKVPSLIHVGLDAGLRPEEVARASVSWVDLDNGLLRVPADDSVKGRDYWQVPLGRETTTMLGQWLEERELYEKYEDSGRIWLNREGNPYNWECLKRLLLNLCDEAGIDTEHREMTWYAVRHSVGTAFSHERGLKAAASQLRRTTLPTRYDQVPADQRRDVLDRIG